MTNGKGREVHLVGSVGLSNAEEVFRIVSNIVGERIRHIPDGETGIARSVWIQCQTPFFMLNPHLEMVAPDPNNTGSYVLPKVPTGGIYGYTVAERFIALARVRPGVQAEDIRFENLGYADWALESYETFSRLKREGVVSAPTRFQVCIPSPRVVLASRVLPDDIEKVAPAYEAGIRREISRIAATVPAEQLAIQWDCTEPPRYELAEASEKEQILDRLVALADYVPAGVEVGYHLCYGDFEHRHGREPRDAGVMVSIANTLAARAKHELAWVHMPVPRNRSDEAYFAPLRDLALDSETRLYLGLVHYTDGVPGTKRRMAEAEKVVSDFGIATECGFGRRPREQDIKELLSIHSILAQT